MLAVCSLEWWLAFACVYFMYNIQVNPCANRFPTKRTHAVRQYGFFFFTYKFNVVRKCVFSYSFFCCSFCVDVCDCVGFMYVWVSVLFRYNINYNNSMIAWNRWAFQMCVFFICSLRFAIFICLQLFFLMIWHFFTAIKDGCVYTWICLREKWMVVRVCVREMFLFSPTRWRTSFLFSLSLEFAIFDED